MRVQHRSRAETVERSENLYAHRHNLTIRAGLAFESRPGIIDEIWCFCSPIFVPMIRDHARFAVGTVALAIMIAPETEANITICS